MTTTETFYVENIKCGGCANTIKGSLEKVLGIQSVEVYVEQHKVSVMGIGVNRATLLINTNNMFHHRQTVSYIFWSQAK